MRNINNIKITTIYCIYAVRGNSKAFFSFPKVPLLETKFRKMKEKDDKDITRYRLTLQYRLARCPAHHTNSSCCSAGVCRAPAHEEYEEH